MKFYQELTLLPNPEVNLHFLWSKVFQQIHLGLVEVKNDCNQVAIGISFPEYSASEKFGSKLRLFAQNESDLQKFDSAKWLSRLTDYIHISDIREVPQKINGYAIYSRHQPKTNGSSLLKRHKKRQEKWQEIIKNPQSSQEEIATAQEKLNKSQEKQIDYDKEKRIKEPFIRLKSLSGNGREFCLFIKKTKIEQPNYQKFSAYGLSSVSTLPEF